MFIPVIFPQPTPRARRRGRIIIACVFVAVAVLLVLQYTPWSIIPARKTADLWGALVGMALMSAFAKYQWSKSRTDD